MSIFNPAPAPWPSRMLSVLRIVTGVLFITFGTMKLFNMPPMPPGQPPIELMSQTGIGGILEVFGGLAFALGLFTRPVAFVLSGMMAVVYFQFHFPQSFWPSVNMGVPAILFCFIYLYFVFSGAGVWSVDAMIARSKADRI
ncbi:MAG: DoxX family protein [Gemmatimonadota bacterium]|nr:DoxX family protein [Gemmatimonadota bacterium]